MSSVEIAEVATAETIEVDRGGGVESDPQRAFTASTNGATFVLLATFFFAFFSATALLIVVGHFGFNTPRSLSPSSGTIGAVSVMTESKSLVVNGGGTFRKVLADEALNPTLGEEYLLFAWFRLRKGIEVGDSAALVGKFEAQTKHRPGWAVSLEGAPDGIRPRVYWNDAEGRGRWYSFASRHIRRREWYMVAVRFSGDTFLSAYVIPARTDEQSDDVFVGGHKIEPAVLARSSADLVIGAYGASRFRGEIGPFGVLKGEELKGNVRDVLRAIQVSPDEFPASVSSSIIQLWASPEIDRGPRKLAIVAGISSPGATTSVKRQSRLSKSFPKAVKNKKLPKGAQGRLK